VKIAGEWCGMDYKKKVASKSNITAAFNSAFAAIFRGLLEKSPKTGEKTTYKALAEHLDVKQQSVSSWANGTTAPDTKHIAPIADYFDVSCDYLLGRIEIKQRDSDGKDAEIKRLTNELETMQMIIRQIMALTDGA